MTAVTLHWLTVHEDTDLLPPRIPAAIKDVICPKVVRTTCGSRILENFVPPYDAFVIERLKEAGFVMVGKVNMDEFAMGSSGENSAFGATANPWALDRVPGGSSSGSAAAVAAGMAPYALGSDTGGSLRPPSARAAALVFEAIAGHDPRDATSAPMDVPAVTDALTSDLRGLRVGVPREYFVEGMDEDVRQAGDAAIGEMERLGAGVDRDGSLPSTDHALAVYYIIAPSEASANLARYDGVKYGYSYIEGESMWDK